MHARLSPVRHVFRYKVFCMIVDVDRVGDVAARSRFFGHNRGWLASFHDRDHGPRDGTPLRPWVEDRLAEHGIAAPGGPIRLLCFPRLFGYVFNPLAIYFCYDGMGVLAAVVHQVSNTFGQSHAYVASIAGRPSPETGEEVRHWADKTFHVSPFIGMDSRYGFTLHPPGERLAVSIRQTEHGQPLLMARLKGVRHAFSDRTLVKALWAHPLMTFKIIGAIHWEAFHLWRKGVPLQPEPPLPSEPATPARPGRMPEEAGTS